MKPQIILAGLLLTPFLASAALPPEYQRQRELTRIIESPDVDDALGGQPIDSISTDGSDTYTVTAGDCSVSVEIVASGKSKPAGWAGPRQFGLSVGEARCSESSDLDE